MHSVASPLCHSVDVVHGFKGFEVPRHDSGYFTSSQAAHITAMASCEVDSGRDSLECSQNKFCNN